MHSFEEFRFLLAHHLNSSRNILQLHKELKPGMIVLLNQANMHEIDLYSHESIPKVWELV